MIKVTFHKQSEIPDSEYKFAVIVSKYQNKWIFCKHKQRTTWEIPGGHRESGETIEDAAIRELIEETGAINFNLHPLTAYCVESENVKTYGMLFFAEITKLSVLSEESEIGKMKLFDSLPNELTYPKIQPHLFEYAMKNTQLCYSYVMGIDNSILLLNERGFDIKPDGDNYTVSFPKYKAAVWEEFIANHLQLEYWNEYLVDGNIIFLFHLKDGIKRFEVKAYNNDEVLKLCEVLCDCKFGSIKAMLLGNWFYKNILQQ